MHLFVYLKIEEYTKANFLIFAHKVIN